MLYMTAVWAGLVSHKDLTLLFSVYCVDSMTILFVLTPSTQLKKISMVEIRTEMFL